MKITINHRHFGNASAGVYMVQANGKIVKSFVWQDTHSKDSRDRALELAELFYNGMVASINIMSRDPTWC